MKSSFLPKNERNIARISALTFRAEILAIFRSFFGRNDDFINLFWDLLTFRLQLTSHALYYKIPYSLLEWLGFLLIIHSFTHSNVLPFYVTAEPGSSECPGFAALSTLLLYEFPWGRIFFINITLCIPLGNYSFDVICGAGFSSFLNCANAQYDTEKQIRKVKLQVLLT